MEPQAIIELVLVRSFGIALTISSPKSNGFYVQMQIACFILAINGMSEKWVAFINYWK
jgi:hypothetical protein